MTHVLAQVSNIPVPSPLKNFKFWGTVNQSVNQNLVGDFVSRLLLFAIIGAGILFFLRLISAGYAFMTSLGDSGKTQNAGKEITNAIIGLLLVLTSYFIVQILQIMFGIKIL